MDAHFPITGILSIGEMGFGIAHLLISHGYRVATFAEDRSERTRDRAQSINIQLCPSIEDLVSLCSVILSIVPPKESFLTAQRVYDNTPPYPSKDQPLYYLDLNATAPALARDTNSLLSSNPNIVYIDGGIIGGPPRQTTTSTSTEGEKQWTLPSLVTSGPSLPSTPAYAYLIKTLNVEHISSSIGAASGLKMCFASMTKGIFALAIQSFVTADSMGIFPELKHYMGKHNPGTLEIVNKGVVGMPSKAWRWINEMQQIGAMMEGEGGFSGELFREIGEVYRVVAEDTVLGSEQVGQRKRGTTVEDVVAAVREGIATKEKVE
ncbi:6-phosphogluconate dehydrogenase [Aspergillus foveolatus]|uniref:6-phosphogluconate dehydrogenase n=1 Tax=Aspergillus foveolatus TaxID=210207 RepID=UPI003CCDF02E